MPRSRPASGALAALKRGARLHRHRTAFGKPAISMAYRTSVRTSIEPRAVLFARGHHVRAGSRALPGLNRADAAQYLRAGVLRVRAKSAVGPPLRARRAFARGRQEPWTEERIR